MPKVTEVIRRLRGEGGDGGKGGEGAVLGGEWVPRAMGGEAPAECGGDVGPAVKLCAQRWGQQVCITPNSLSSSTPSLPISNLFKFVANTNYNCGCCE